MDQLVLSAHSNTDERSPKRFRLSLKQEKCQPVVTNYFPKHILPTNLKSGGDNSFMILQDENVSPNCKRSESNISLFVDANAVDWHRETSALGLPNRGNTCFVNSVLQVLRYTPNFLNCLHLLAQVSLSELSSECNKLKETDLFVQLHSLFSTMKTQEDLLCENFAEDIELPLLSCMDSFLSSLREVSSLFEEGEQHDAHELLLTVLSTFNICGDSIRTDVDCYKLISSTNLQNADVCKSGNMPQRRGRRRLKRNSKRALKSRSQQLIQTKKFEISSNFFNLGFEGKMRHIVECLECERRSGRTESFTNLEVSVVDDLVSEGTIDLRKCLAEKVILSGENKYFCDDCYHLNEACMSSEITCLPSNLLIHCSWQKQWSAHLEKDTTKILIPMFLETSKNGNIFQSPTNDVYCLLAVILHLGTSTENGHYVSFIRDRLRSSETIEACTQLEECCVDQDILNLKWEGVGQWLLFDDQTVSPVLVEEDSYDFPYYQLLQITASPSIILYHKM